MILVDTSIWSLALRRRRTDLSSGEVAFRDELEQLVQTGKAALIGAIRQELLSGIATRSSFESLRTYLAAFPDLLVSTKVHEAAAQCFNACRAKGVVGSPIDMLICAVAVDRNLPIFTADRDFTAYHKHLPIRLHHAS
jgi:predicted nucleic acid-binding protein